MTTETGTTLPDPRAEALVVAYERSGYRRVAPALLQPAEPFLDLSGEDIRRRMFLTTDAEGRELCLRPDLTIPVSCDYLASPESGTAQGFCYLGPVFRAPKSDVSDFDHSKVGQASPEFIQAGIESFGRTDTAAADAEMIALGLEATSHYGLSAPEIRMGDVALFSALIAALDLAPAWKRRLIKDFNRKSNLAHDLEKLTLSAHNKRPEYEGVLAALAGSDPKGAQAMVSDLISIAGVTTVGGRTVDEIAERFLEQASLGTGSTLPQETRALIEKFLSIAGNPDDAAAALRARAADANLAMEPAIDLFENRTGFLAARGIDLARINFSTSFGRSVDYYTGVVFELHDPRTRVVGQLVAGGRYDGLLTRLGAKAPVPAVGFAVWIDRIAACGAPA
jgi:ATP phosphoribosyltransferase regulatory subunit